MLIASRQFFTTKNNLPYYEVQWIETDGVASYINTGIKSSYDMKIVLDFQTMTLPTDVHSALCGARYDETLASGRRFAILVSQRYETFYAARPTVGASSGFPFDTQRHVVTLDMGYMILDGVSKETTVQPTDGFNEDFTIGKDGVMDAATSPSRCYGDARFYSVKIYKNNVLVFDGIPVKVGSNGCMYDNISKVVLSNAGSGVITPGPKKT